MSKVRRKPYHIDSFIKHNFLVQFSLIVLLIAGIISDRYLPNFWSLFNLFGVGFYLAGFAIFAWAGWHIEPYNRYHSPKDLVTDGPYRSSRNPQGLAVAVMLIATALVSGSFVVLGVAVLFVAYMAFGKIPAEEKKLKARFGKDYEAYYSKTRRWL